MNLGLCLPDSCTEYELAIILRQIFKERTLIVSDLYATDFSLIDVRDLKDNYQWLFNWQMITVR